MWDVGCGMWVGRIRSARDDVLRCFHRPRATGFFFASPSGEVAAGRRGVVCQEVGCRVWEVGAAFGAGRLALAAPKPPPYPPPREGALSDAGCEPRAFRRRHHIPLTTHYEPKGRTHRSAPTSRRTTNHNYRPQATSHLPLFSDSSDEAIPGGQDRGPCRMNRQDSVAAVPFATTGLPVTVTTHHEPAGGHTGPPLRQDTPRVTSRNYKPQAAGHLPLFRHSSQAGQ